jgi:putative membrane protein
MIKMKREQRYAWLAVALALLLVLVMLAPAFAQPRAPEPPGEQARAPLTHQITPQDREFLHSAAQANMGEIVIGRLGVARAQNAQVRDLAEHLVAEHREGNLQLNKLAQQLPITLPVEVEAETTQLANELGSLRGAEFDRRFVEIVTEKHRESIEKHTEQVLDGHHVEIRYFAAQNLPVLTRHFLKTEQVGQQLAEAARPQG